MCSPSEYNKEQLTDDACLSLITEDGGSRRKGVSILYRRYSPQFSRYYRRNRVPSDQVEDVVQDAFINIVRACGDFRGDCDIKLWLWTVARNAMMTHFRKVRPEYNLDEDGPGLETLLTTGKGDTSPGDSLEECVQNAFSTFAEDHPDRAEVLKLSAIEGWSIAELSELLSRTLGATREYISQCRKKFRPYLDLCKDYL